ncbi:MAG: hypothetical protein IJC02_06720 [Lachnospiraceae bacterium]|nr:hypothetical protein [Lachnospiraceae bacterium]
MTAYVYMIPKPRCYVTSDVGCILVACGFRKYGRTFRSERVQTGVPVIGKPMAYNMEVT